MAQALTPTLCLSRVTPSALPPTSVLPLSPEAPTTSLSLAHMPSRTICESHQGMPFLVAGAAFGHRRKTTREGAPPSLLLTLPPSSLVVVVVVVHEDILRLVAHLVHMRWRGGGTGVLVAREHLHELVVVDAVAVLVA